MAGNTLAKIIICAILYRMLTLDLKKCHLWYILSHQLFISLRSCVIHQVKNTFITKITLINSSAITTNIQGKCQ